eukprot:s358_g2.t1
MPKKKKSTGTSPAAGYAEDPGDAELSAVASAGAWTKVQPWFQRKGGVADDSKIALREADGDRNVVAISGLSKGEAIFRVPAQIWFTAEGLSSHEAGRAVLKWAEHASEEVGLSAEHVELCLLAVLILLEGAKTGFWSDYIAALPWSTSLPLSWTLERLSTLNGAAPQWQIQEKKRELARAYSSVADSLQAAAKNAFQSACPNSNMFIKAFSLAHSRAMGIRSVGDQGRRWNLAMLPFVDMLNHSRQPEVGWDVVRTKDAGLCVVGRTLCDVKAGTELRIRYQFASAQAFFATYGFVEAVEEVRPTELRLAIDSGGGPAVLNVTSAQSLRKLLSRCRVKVATSEELKGARDLEDAARFPLSQRCEIAAFRHLQDLVQQRVQEPQMWSDGVDGMVRRLCDADGTGWRRVDAKAGLDCRCFGSGEGVGVRLDGLDLEPTVALILTLGYGPARSGLVTTVAVIASVSVRIFSLHHGRILPVWPCAAIDKRGQADQMAPSSEALLPNSTPSLGTLAWNFFVMGTTAFGGPPVHISMFRARFVEKYGWLSSERFAELFAMANCLPGPSSTQVAYAIGITQGGVLGGLIAGFCFVIPGAILLSLLGFVSQTLSEQIEEPASPANAVAIACSAVGVALVFVAITGLIKKQVFEAGNQVVLGGICFFTGAICLLVHPAPAWLNPTLIFVGGLTTIIYPASKDSEVKHAQDTGKSGMPVALAVCIFLLYVAVAAFTLWRDTFDHGWVMPFLTAGMFVWGGGPVVLPMLMTFLTPSWISPTIFLAGISFAEMMPGPVFNISCFLGIQLALNSGVYWLWGIFLCWAGLMGPGVTLIFGAYTLWDELRKQRLYQHALPGLNAAAVGLLVPTMFVVYDTLQARSPWQSGSRALVVLAYYFIELVKVNVPLVVVVSGLAGLAWLNNFVQSVLESIQEPGNELTAARLAVLAHSRMPICTGDVQRKKSQSDTFVSQKMSIRDEGGEKGRGYFANRSISAGELLLSEEPHVFNPDDDDFGAVAAVHVLAAEEEGSELRVAAAESEGISEAEAFRWLSGISSLTKERAAKALAAARNNGFCTSLQSTGEEVWLLFRKLSVFNHSCWPSCSVYRDPSTGISHVLAIRPVDKGTELTIHYADDLILLPKELRKAFLPGRFGFACECDRCEEEDQAAAKVENLLLKHAEGRSDTWQEETQLAHAMKTAHAGLCKMRQERGRPAGMLLLVAIVSYWKNAACNIRRVCARALIQVWPCRSCPAPDFSKLLWLAASQGGVASARPRIMNQLGLRDGQQTAAKGRTAEEGEGESAKPLARQLFTRGQDKMDWFFRAFNSTRIYETFLKSSPRFYGFIVWTSIIGGYCWSRMWDHIWDSINQGKLYRHNPYVYPIPEDDE